VDEDDLKRLQALAGTVIKQTEVTVHELYGFTRPPRVLLIWVNLLRGPAGSAENKLNAPLRVPYRMSLDSLCYPPPAEPGRQPLRVFESSWTAKEHYDLKGFVAHSGQTADDGHYFFIDQGTAWKKFDDDREATLSPLELDQATNNAPSSAYTCPVLLMYQA